MLLLGGQLVLQDVMTSSGMRMRVVFFFFLKTVRSGLIRKFLAVVASPLHKALQQAVKNVAPVPHQPDVLRSAVHTLPVQNGSFKHVTELLP